MADRCFKINKITRNTYLACCELTFYNLYVFIDIIIYIPCIIPIHTIMVTTHAHRHTEIILYKLISTYLWAVVGDIIACIVITLYYNIIVIIIIVYFRINNYVVVSEYKIC